MTWKIIADSGCDYRQLPTPAIDTTFVSVPLTIQVADQVFVCLLYTSPSPRDRSVSRMPSSA